MHNPSRAVVESRLAEAQGEMLRAAAYPNPVLNFTSGRATGRAAEAGSITASGLELAQPVDWPAARRARQAAAAAGVGEAKLEAELAGVELYYEVQRWFQTVSYYSRALELARANAADAEQIDVIVGRRVEGGEAAEIDRVRSQVERLKANRSVQALTRELAAARVALNALCGNTLPADFELADVLQTELPAVDLAQSRSEALEVHPGLRLKEAIRAQRDAEVRQEEIQRRPTIEYGFSADRQFDANTVSGTLRIGLPIWNRNAGGIATAAARVKEAAAEIEKVRLEIIKDVDIAVQEYEQAKEQVAAYDGGLRQAAREAYRIETLRFHEGEVDFLHLLDTQRTARQTEVEYLQSLFDAQISLAVLDRAKGKGGI